MQNSLTLPATRNKLAITLFASLVTFLTYCTVYGFRKGFTVCTFDGIAYAGISYKVWLVISQVLGYASSKFYGIRFIAELKKMGRGKVILYLTGISWLALFLFGITPAPWNIFFMFINGFPLGMIWGIVFSYVEGRMTTDFIGAALSVSFIFSSGFVKSVAESIKLHFNITELWVPFYTGLAFAIPLIISVIFLEKIPPPSEEDIISRSKRIPMSKEDRKKFINIFLPGLVAAISVYVFSTLFRDLRDNFIADMWIENGYGNQPGLFTRTETPVSVILLILMGSMIMVKNNLKAFKITHYIIMVGFLITGITSLLYIGHLISPFWWLALVGLGLYTTYIPFNCIFFERLFATFKYPGTVGFLIYIADSFGYLGSVAVLFTKEFLKVKIKWSSFYSHGVVVLSVLGIAGTILSLYYSQLSSGKQFPPMAKKSAIVVGAGIVGMAAARALALKGYAVNVYERNLKASGASVRNFGMVWPIGQPAGKQYERAIRSRNCWKEIGDSSRLWYDPVGSLHLAYHQMEWQVLQELFKAFKEEGRDVMLLNTSEVHSRSGIAKRENCLGGLYSREELIVDPREAIAFLPEYFQAVLNIRFNWGRAVTAVSPGNITVGSEKIDADLIFICSGSDFKTLYTEEFEKFPLTKCKLQMMRLTEEGSPRIGASLCGGLSLIHYPSFKAASSLNELRQYYEKEMPEYLKWGIHVMVSQNHLGHLTIGDSHEYGLSPDPFDKQCINELILNYLNQFTSLRNPTLIETWNGVYGKLTNHETEIFYSPEPGVYILNGVGGTGMTMSFGLAEELINTL